MLRLRTLMTMTKALKSNHIYSRNPIENEIKQKRSKKGNAIYERQQKKFQHYKACRERKECSLPKINVKKADSSLIICNHYQAKS